MDQIIDTHTHFFDPHRPQGVPWPPSDNPDLYRTTLPEHFLEVAAGHGVSSLPIIPMVRILSERAFCKTPEIGGLLKDKEGWIN